LPAQAVSLLQPCHCSLQLLHPQAGEGVAAASLPLLIAESQQLGLLLILQPWVVWQRLCVLQLMQRGQTSLIAPPSLALLGRRVSRSREQSAGTALHSSKK
jgi:hypothetical protein